MKTTKIKNSKKIKSNLVLTINVFLMFLGGGAIILLEYFISFLSKKEFDLLDCYIFYILCLFFFFLGGIYDILIEEEENSLKGIRNKIRINYFIKGIIGYSLLFQIFQLPRLFLLYKNEVYFNNQSLMVLCLVFEVIICFIFVCFLVEVSVDFLNKILVDNEK